MNTLQKPDIATELKIRDGIFDNNVDIDKWKLPETNSFTPFIRSTFTDKVQENISTIHSAESADSPDAPDTYIPVWDSDKKTFTKIKPFKHQLFVKHYLNNRSPYRGLLLYHGLGSGKSGASVVIAEGFINRRVVLMLPASLATNYKTEILTFGSQSYKLKNHWIFVPYSFGAIISKTVDEREEIYQQFIDIGIPRKVIDILNTERNKAGYDKGIWLIDTSKRYPNYISAEEKQDILDFQRANADDEDDEVIEMLTDQQKEEIKLQINSMYKYKYTFIHTNAGKSTIKNILKLNYNYKIIKRTLFGKKKKDSSLTQENKLQILDEMYKKNINPFDDKVIVIDEVHNLAASIASNGFNAPIIYELLMRAKNIKLVLLSGTPVINTPYELAIICNLLKGFTLTYEFTLQSMVSDTDAFKTLIHTHKDIFNYQLENKKLEVILNPRSFESIDDNIDNFSVVIKGDVDTHTNHFIDSFQAFMRKNNYTLEDAYEINYYTMFTDILTGDSSKWWKKNLRLETVLRTPDTPDKELCPFRLMANKFKKKQMNTFSERYINLDDLSVVNVLDFKKRILGIISFYNEVATYDRDNPIFPGIIYADSSETDVLMSDYQFKLYVQEREVERKYEELGKKMSFIDAITNTANLFKVYSRTMGIIVFPPNIERPRHSKLRNFIQSKYPDIDTKEEKKLLEKLYIEKCYESIRSLKPDNLRYSDTSNEYNLNILSPKYTLILKNIEKTPGLVFCYSQFRSIEGIGLFTKVLQFNGYYPYEISDDTEEEKRQKQLTTDFKVKDKVRFETSTTNWETYTLFKIEYKDDSMRDTLYHLSRTDGTIITTTIDKIFKCCFSLWTGEEDIETRKQLLTNFNKDSNKHGNESLILLTTSAGAEGISLMNVRQVHIIEPYWNNVRIKQVIGRARRVRSHIQLPNEQRNVTIFQYIIRFSKAQLDGNWISTPMIQALSEQEEAADLSDDTEPKVPISNMSQIIKQKDKSLTSDETLYTIATNKSTILDKFLKIFKEVAVDCEFNKRDNIQTEDMDIKDTSTFACYTNLEDSDREDSVSLHIISEHADTDMIVTDDRSVIKEKKNIIVINQPKLANGTHLHSLILDIPVEYTLHAYLEQNISQKIPLYNLYTYYAIHVPSSQKNIIGYIVMNPDKTLSLTDLDTTYFTFDLIKQYMLIEKAIHQLDSSIKSPLKKYSDEITPSETVKWSTYVQEKIQELKSRETWICKICKKEYNLTIDSCPDHPRMTRTLCNLLNDKQLKKSLRLLG